MNNHKPTLTILNINIGTNTLLYTVCLAATDKFTLCVIFQYNLNLISSKTFPINITIKTIQARNNTKQINTLRYLFENFNWTSAQHFARDFLTFSFAPQLQSHTTPFLAVLQMQPNYSIIRTSNFFSILASSEPLKVLLNNSYNYKLKNYGDIQQAWHTNNRGPKIFPLSTL